MVSDVPTAPTPTIDHRSVAPPGPTPASDDTNEAVPELDLDVVERDLAAVETALQRLSDGTYWTDEVTGEPIAEHVLAADPTVRRA
jgi:RNA polymerase-binding transcription factor DksA